MQDLEKLEPTIDIGSLIGVEHSHSPQEQTIYNPVSKPKHYNIGRIETIDYIEDVLSHSKAPHRFIDACHANCLKYIGSRLWHKEKPLEDMKKARQYLDWMIKKTEEEMTND